MDEMMLDQWSNSACLGYVVAALENLGYVPDRISEVLIELLSRTLLVQEEMKRIMILQTNYR